MARKFNADLPFADRSPSVPARAINPLEQFAASSFDALFVQQGGGTTAVFTPFNIAQAGTTELLLFTQDYPTRIGATFTQAGLGAASTVAICPGAAIQCKPVLTVAEWAAWSIGTRTDPALPATTDSIFGERISATTATAAVAVTGYAFTITRLVDGSNPLCAADGYLSVETPGQGFGYPAMEAPTATVITPVILDQSDFTLGIQTGNATLDAFSAGVPYQINIGTGIGLVVGLHYT